MKPKEVFKKYGSIEGALLVEASGAALTSLSSIALTRCPGVVQEFVLFISTTAKTQELTTIVPLDLLREIRSLYRLVAPRGKLDRHVRPHGDLGTHTRTHACAVLTHLLMPRRSWRPWCRFLGWIGALKTLRSS
jgi:hypothetical protein